MEVFVFSCGMGRDYFFGPLSENILTKLSKSVLPVLQERDWSLLFHKGLSHSGPWTGDWVPFSLTALSSVQNICLPLFSNGHIPAILQKLDQSPCQENSLKQACSKMLLRGASSVKWRFGADPGRVRHPSRRPAEHSWLPGFVLDEVRHELPAISYWALHPAENEAKEEKVCSESWSNGQGGTVEIINTHALFITIIAWHKQLHSTDFSLWNELERGPSCFCFCVKTSLREYEWVHGIWVLLNHRVLLFCFVFYS